jgi:hypothetical protein
MDVKDCTDIKARIDAGVEDARVRRYLIKRSIDFGCVQLIPDEWEVEVENNG